MRAKTLRLHIFFCGSETGPNAGRAEKTCENHLFFRKKIKITLKKYILLGNFFYEKKTDFCAFFLHGQRLVVEPGPVPGVLLHFPY